MTELTKIDWNKMPEGAEYVYPLSDGIFYKKEYGIIMIWSSMDGRWLESVDKYYFNHSVKIPPLRTVYVKDERSINDIAKAMIDGEVFYSADGRTSYKWSGSNFRDSDGNLIGVIGGFHRKEIQPVDERQEFIDAFVNAYHKAGTATYSLETLGASLYEAGFRKPEGKKQ